jgi:cysteine desulfurase
MIYLDNASTTRVDERVLEEMLPFFTVKYGNSSSPHSFGQEAKEALELARNRVAGALNSFSEEIIFTSGGTESDNLAILGVAQKKAKGHIITSSIEHPAVHNACAFLEKNGFQVTYLPVTADGFISPESLANSIRIDTILVSIMHANNEIGTIQPIKELAKIAHEKNILFHTDAVQSFGKIPTDVKDLGVDLLSVSGHKIHGPKGVGALFVKKGTAVSPILHGGGHERGLRSGTENISGIVGFGAAAKLAKEEMGTNEKTKVLRDKLINGLLAIEDTILNGAREPRLPNNANISFKFIEGEGILLLLDANGIAVSTGSACSSKSLKPSHVLIALGRSPEDAHGSVRMSLSKFTTSEDIEKVLEVLPRAVESLRKMSPFKSDAEVKKFSEKCDPHEHDSEYDDEDDEW